MNHYPQLCSVIKSGGIIAYPTEAVYGLGCCPFNEAAVMRLIQLKQRPSSKGLILIAATWEHILPLIAPLDENTLAPARQSWPGAITWVFPASRQAPSWLVSAHQTIALRLTAHPIARQLCNTINGPLISTSANLSDHPPCRTAQQVRQVFGDSIDLIISGKTGKLAKPTPIIDLITQEILRE